LSKEKEERETKEIETDDEAIYIDYKCMKKTKNFTPVMTLI